LDEKYEEVKYTTKLGFCFNSRCPLPDTTKVERKTMGYCTRY